MAHYIALYYHPELGERRFELVSNKSYRIGAKRDNDIVIPQSDVSRYHAILKTFDSTFQITDLDSKNGTFVNGTKVTSAECSCGDRLNISSACLEIVEVSSEMYAREPEIHPTPPLEEVGDGSEDTVQYRGEASVADMLDLLETISTAAPRGDVGAILAWGVERFALESAVVLYLDGGGSLAMVASAGEVGTLVHRDELLELIQQDLEASRKGSSRRRQIREHGDRHLVASVRAGYALVLRLTSFIPSVEDMRAMIAAVAAVIRRSDSDDRHLALSREDTSTVGVPSRDAGAELKPDGLVDLPLAEARDIFERWMVLQILDANNGNQTRAAKHLGLSRAGLFKKMRRLGIGSTESKE